MTKQFLRSFRPTLVASLMVSLIASLLCGIARADDLGAGKSLPVPAAAFSPIGKVYSLGEVSINGRRVYGHEMIWGGELLQVSNDASACAVLDSIGRVVFERGAALRLAAVESSESDTGHVLIVSLISGSIHVRLQPGASAYLETCGAAFTTTNGASLYAEVREGQPVIAVSTGAVEINAPNQDLDYIVEPVIADPLTGRATRRAPSTRRISPSQSGTVQQQQVSVEVSERNKKTKRVTPAGPGRKVTIALLTPGVGEIGSQSITVPTNNFGVATATFTAGPNPGETKIRATDESGAEWIGKIIVTKSPGFWRTRNEILLGAAAAAAIIVFVDRHRNRGPLRQQPPIIQ